MNKPKKDPRWVTKICKARETFVDAKDHEKFKAEKYYEFYMAWGFKNKDYEGLYLCISSNGDWVSSQVAKDSEMGLDFMKTAIGFLQEKKLYTGLLK